MRLGAEAVWKFPSLLLFVFSGSSGVVPELVGDVGHII
jgi:hypothetical protein